jgi:hypothetical protein
VGCLWDPLGFFGSFDPLLLLLLVKALIRSVPFGLKTLVLRVQDIENLALRNLGNWQVGFITTLTALPFVVSLNASRAIAPLLEKVSLVQKELEPR